MRRGRPVKIQANINYDLLEREIISRFGFFEFAKRAWPYVDPADLVVERHFQVLCEHLQAVYEGKFLNLLINIPPSTSKSMIASVLFPAWLFTRDPAYKILCFAGDQALASSFSRRCRQLIQSEWYRKRWPEVQLAEDNNQITSFTTKVGGFRMSLTTQQMVTGFHADAVIVDDPEKVQSAGKAETQRVQAWWRETLPSRFRNQSEARKIVVQQRIHENDLSGFILSSDEEFVHLCMPMRFDPARAFKTPLGADWRTRAGQLLCPKRFPLRAVERLERAFSNSQLISAQLQQNPTPGEGGVFKAEWLSNRYEQVPQSGRIYFSLDANFKDNDSESDYSALTVWLHSGGKHYLINVVRTRGFLETCQILRNAARRYPKYVCALVEEAANGYAIRQSLESEGFRIKPIKPDGGKVARAWAAAPAFDTGQVVLPLQADWLADYEHEILGFPRAAHDDMVDSSTQYLNYMNNSSYKKMVAGLKALTESPQ